jgi:hypothetical protein
VKNFYRIPEKVKFKSKNAKKAFERKTANLHDTVSLKLCMKIPGDFVELLNVSFCGG